MDEQEIVGLHLGPVSYRVGHGRIDHIIESQKAGQMAFVPWFKCIDKLGRVMFEINAAHVHVIEHAEATDD